MSFRLPLDDNAFPVALLGFRPGGTQDVVVSGSSARNVNAIQTAAVTITSDVACRFEVGNSGVTAGGSSPVLFATDREDIILKSGQTHIAFISLDGATGGTAYVMERE